jgi:hypothetical protein
MTITLTPDLEKIVLQNAREQGTTPDVVVINAVREKFGLGLLNYATIIEPRDEWERRLLRVGTACGAIVSDEALSSEGLYCE